MISTGILSAAVKVARIPEGRFPAVWGGYVITVKREDGDIRISTENGVRGWVNGTLIVTDQGYASFEQDKRST